MSTNNKPVFRHLDWFFYADMTRKRGFYTLDVFSQAKNNLVNSHGE